MIYLTFDIEEFDVPREKGLEYDFELGMEVSRNGTTKILDILERNQIKCTLFCTANFVENALDIIQRAIKSGHEIASHGVDHWVPKPTDPVKSKKIIEELTGVDIYGYRQPRMFSVDDKLIKDSGYTYNSSINPAFIPGKYKNHKMPRTAFMKDGVLQIPASVTPKTRIPLFWLALHDIPEFSYHYLAKSVLKHDGYFMTYFHPWEFVDHSDDIKKYMSKIITHNIGDNMCKKLDRLIKMFKKQNEDFATLKDFKLND